MANQLSPFDLSAFIIFSTSIVIDFLWAS
jgi:hypothetical protein